MAIFWTTKNARNALVRAAKRVQLPIHAQSAYQICIISLKENVHLVVINMLNAWNAIARCVKNAKATNTMLMGTIVPFVRSLMQDAKLAKEISAYHALQMNIFC